MYGEPITRPAIYVRVSSKEQVEGYSLEAQERTGRAFAVLHGWGEAEVFADAGHSGFTDVTERCPAFSEMRDRAERGPDESGPLRAELREVRRRCDRLYQRLRLIDEEYDEQMAALDDRERLLPPAPLQRRALAEGLIRAQGLWPAWLPQTCNRYLRGILRGVLINGKLCLPVPTAEVIGLLRLAGAT